jgi:agmatinase
MNEAEEERHMAVEQQMGFGYEGIHSFCRMPICFEVNELNADVAVVGICLDTGTTYRSGTRFGPKAIREASMIYSMGYIPGNGFLDIEQRKYLLGGTRIVDCGDIPTLPTLLVESMDVITQYIKDIRARGATPVVLGGDHSISFPVVRAFDDIPLHLVQFDTHLDLMDEVFGIRYSHGNPMKRISELGNVKGLTHIGIRGLLNPPDWSDEALHPKSTFYTAEEVHEKGVEYISSKIPDCENLYITLDIDSLDPTVAPGTGTPEPGGLTYLQLRYLLRECARKGRFVGMDLVEVNPLYDQTGRTAQVAARLIIDLLGAAMQPG